MATRHSQAENNINHKIISKNKIICDPTTETSAASVPSLEAALATRHQARHFLCNPQAGFFQQHIAAN